MLTNCPCPPNAALTPIPGVVCADDFGQLQKVAFQRIKDGAGTFNEFASPNGIDMLASWVTKIAAANGTRIVLSPYIQAPATEPGEAITFGGGNDTPDGIEIPVGTNPTTFTGVLRSLPQSVIKAIKELACEAATGNLGVFLFDNKGQIKALKGATAGAYRPIPIRSFFVSDLSLGGIDTPDGNNISWSFPANWSDDTVNVAAQFNPITDLVPVAVS